MQRSSPSEKKRTVHFNPLRIPKKPDNIAVNESSKKNIRILEFSNALRTHKSRKPEP
ncbi:hypothetical protein LEP1GSC062_3055 [Leptospira alexanderi serovar Manhao 3 str. L 60]|uniref:Uncharacterized protein n=1 Tax=Leptospira alexanderi serovar Manhao 3 str. L 60 TaxID=1049759 RepID=V6IDS4_9LEPT|nr:hypothetical protein LEP1GSC062_3055 [Leptospira alexanderi serovar Manhao 3 str. L 60]